MVISSGSVRLVTDSRIAPVEDNLVAFFDAAFDNPMFEPAGFPDVRAVHCNVSHPLFNSICGATFPDDEVEERASAVVATYVERGLPFLWWATPSGHAESLRPVLTGAGLVVEDVPGMVRSCEASLDPRTHEGLSVDVAESPAELRTSIEVMAEGFAMPDDLVEPLLAVVGSMEGSFVQVTARLEGRPVGSGTVFFDGATGGLYNIATVADARGQGVGRAVTATLANVARERGCAQTVLHASEAGRPLYDRLGYEAVCVVPQFVWIPPGGAAA
jgi:GNAT superfamily N-acetyltransferase